ncbi:MAG: S8 family serine peptidase [Bacteroidota bacterium]
MSELKIKNEHGELTLKKSSELVGLRTDQRENVEEKEFVDKEHLKNLGGFNVVSLKREGQSVDDKLDEVRLRADVEVGTHVYYAEGSDKPVIPTGEIFITFEEGVSEEEQAIVLEEFNLEKVETLTPDRIVAKVTPNSPNPIKVAAFLQELSMVRTAEPDLDMLLDEYLAPPSDDLFDHQWHLSNTGRLPDVNFNLKLGADAKVVDAWSRLGNQGAARVVVAVIDNGFDLSHPDLRTKVFRPFDLWNQTKDVSQGDPRFTHGTPCASIALASSNGSGIVGAAPNALFMPVSGTSFSSRITQQMFDYCIEQGADIISCSWGTTDPNFRLNGIKEAAIAKAATKGRKGKGCIIIFSAGNEDLSYVNYYAAHPNVIAVGASTSDDNHASYSNRGKELSVTAPSNGGWPIIAARAWWDQGWKNEFGARRFWADGRDRGEHYKHFGGTSSSAPLVAGVCALILSANPDLTAKEVKDILQQTADKIGHPSEYVNGHSRKFGYGRVNADRAVAEALRRKEQHEVPVEVEDSISTGRGLFEFSVRKQQAKGWGVQIGAFAEYGNVLIQVEKLQKQFGEKVIVNINELNGKTVYKVVVGAFAEKGDADRLYQRMKDAGVKGFARNLADLA